MVARHWEPTRGLSLKWGHYVDRYYAGLVLIVAGSIHLQGANSYTLPILLIGSTTLLIGWSIVPAKGWRRMLVAFPAVSQALVLLTGPMSMWTLAIPLACWLVVRHRPLISYVALLLPLANGIILARYFQEYSSMPQALTISAVVLVAAAWLARFIAVSALTRRSKRAIFSELR